MRKFSCLGVFIIIAIFSLVSIATAADTKIGLIDTQQILVTSNAGKAGKASLDAQIKKTEDELAKKRADLEAKDKKIQQESAVLSKEARDKRIQELTQEVNAYETQRQKLIGEVQTSERVFLEKITQQIVQVCAQIGKAEGYTVIFDRRASSAYYVADGVDITARVIDQLNKIK